MNDKLKERKGIIWVHNLAFEFQFLLNVFEFNNVFAREQRKPIKCEIADTDFELRCSLMLASMKLENIPKQYNLKINKKTGQLDYDKIRHNKTSLTDDEMEYCEYDCLVVYEYIKLMIKEYGHLKDIPLTSTGKIRDKFKKYLQEKDGSKFGVRNWKRYVSKLTPNAETFIDLVKCFAGGYTHANAYFSNKLLTDVKSVDFTSSYPYVMLSEKFPSGIFVKENNFNIEDIDYNRAYILKLKFKNIRSICAMNYISLYKAGSSVVNVNVDNGRIYSADELTITITEQDYYIISNTYEFESVEVLECKSTTKKYLPKSFLEFIIKLYKDKNDLKKQLAMMDEDDVKYAKVKEMYDLSKAYLNSLYGMCVTNYISDEITFTDSWQKRELTYEDIENKLQEQVDKCNVLLPYAWGVWITAYARKNLWLGIMLINEDVVYTDTDSIKYLGNYDYVVEEYNKIVEEKLLDMTRHFGFNYDDIDGIGKFDIDGHYKEFKTLGAKKYCYRNQNDIIHITVSGVNKKTGVKALNNNVNNFSPKLLFDYESAGKLNKAYNDKQPMVTVVDYEGTPLDIEQPYGICLYPTTYNLDITKEYYDYIEKASTGCQLLNNL